MVAEARDLVALGEDQKIHEALNESSRRMKTAATITAASRAATRWKHTGDAGKSTK